MVEHHAIINGISVNAKYSEKSVNEIFIPLLKRLTQLQQEKGKRILVMLAAPPGAGKTTLLTFLEKLSRERENVGEIQVIGMDGFHRRQEYLLNHDILCDGRRVSMVEIKGAPVTFDLERLTASVKKVAAGEICGWPVYDRLLHNPVENAVCVDGSIVLLEGNYLLLDEEGWRDLSAYADYTISIRADEEFLKSRLIDRKLKTGVAKESAMQFVDFSDMANVRICLEKTKPADLQLDIDACGEIMQRGEKNQYMFRKMRRYKQQISTEECLQILKEQPRGVLSVLGDDDYPYGIPLDHWYCEENGKLYFHCAKTGHKLDAIRKHDKVSYCVYDQGFRKDGDWALNIRSVVVFCRARIVDDAEDDLKQTIAIGLCKKFTDDEAFLQKELTNAMPRAAFLELTPEYMTGKLVNES